MSLAEFRGCYRACRRANWWVWWMVPGPVPQTEAERRHGCFLFAAALVLPFSWHRAHEGRLSERYYEARRQMLAMHRPLRNDARNGSRQESLP